MLSGILLPAHPKPLPDELLSSWIVRIAEANCVKLHTLSRLLFGTNQRSPWIRDIDRQAPDWIIDNICRATGTPKQEALRTTFNDYCGVLFSNLNLCGQLRWVLPIKAWSAKRKGYGEQYCPQCLAEDEQPYFRRRWRIAIHTFCPDHEAMLYDACAFCGEPIAYHRRDFTKNIELAGTMANCHFCGADLRLARTIPIDIIDPQAYDYYKSMLKGLKSFDSKNFDLCFYSVIHQLCKILISRSNYGRLANYIAKNTINYNGEIEHLICDIQNLKIESMRTMKRYIIISLALWLIIDARRRLGDAWRAKAVQYNSLTKDFSNPPKWYKKIAMQLNRRQKSSHPLGTARADSPNL